MASNPPPPSPARVPMPRRASLRLPPQPLPTPIPPSLRHSPYLNAPIFTHQVSNPRIPSEADEKWLQDTVPISPKGSTFAKGGQPSSTTAKAASDRRGSVAQQPSRYASSPYHAHPLPPSGPMTPVADCYSAAPSSPTSARHTSTQRYLAHSLAPPPEPFLRPHIGYAGRPVQLNQAHSNPTLSGLGGSSADQAYFAPDDSNFYPRPRHV